MLWAMPLEVERAAIDRQRAGYRAACGKRQDARLDRSSPRISVYTGEREAAGAALGQAECSAAVLQNAVERARGVVVADNERTAAAHRSGPRQAIDVYGLTAKVEDAIDDDVAFSSTVGQGVGRAHAERSAGDGRVGAITVSGSGDHEHAGPSRIQTAGTGDDAGKRVSLAGVDLNGGVGIRRRDVPRGGKSASDF